MRWTIVGIMASLLWTGCFQDYRECEPIDEARAAQLPDRLSETGLFSDMGSETLAPGVFPFTPRFPLWSDGAEKRRWILLPPGTRIDTSQMDSWQFPEGTKLWKEFTRDGVRVETRLLQKVGPNPADWAPMAYVWDDAGKEAVAARDGVKNARETEHDVPAASQCMGCHGGRESRVLGFSAIQLSHTSPPGELNLRELVRRDVLTQAPAEDFVVPGDDRAQAALGYLHANCSHCHNQNRPLSDGARCFDPQKRFDFSLRVQDLGRVEDTGVYRTAVGTGEVKRGKPDDSEMIRRVSERDPDMPTMPPLATEIVDDHGVAVLRDWISHL